LELGSYIHQLLFDNEIVIIPGFGAFVSNYKPAQIDREQEILLPPSKEISFDRKLKNDDGLLVNYIAANEGISRPEALRMVEEFKENIQYRLEKGEVIEFEGLGTLNLDEKNNAVFVADPGENFLLDSYGLVATSLKSEQGPPRTNETIVPEEKNKRNLGWMLFLLIPVAAGAVFIYLNFFIPPKHNNILPETNILMPDTTVIEEPGAYADSVQTNPGQDSISLTTIDSEKTDIKILSGNKYYLVGGSFKEQENADKYFKKAEKLGYQPIHLGKQGNFYIVAIGLFNSFDEADSAMSEYVKREPDSGLWIKRVSSQ
jgi:nucleoid DNA-binding protein